MMAMDKPFFETHSHTPLCKHAVGQPSEYAASAQKRGLAGVAITCHGPLPDGISANVRMAPGELPDYVAMVEKARREWEGRMEVRMGLESDYLPGLEDWARELHGAAPFDYVIGSVHPHISLYRERYFHEDWPAFHRQYFAHLAEAAESGLFDCLAHPDIVKNLGSESWDVGALMPEICAVLDRIAATGVAMELNTSGLQKRVVEMNPGREILEQMARRGIPVVVGADAHHPVRVGERFEEALAMLEEAGYAETNYFLGRERIPVPLAEARACLIPPDARATTLVEFNI
jgi:histidinol-phosphatase (PHP family)